jgi:cell wall-associated NlpC family hydrolase
MVYRLYIRRGIALAALLASVVAVLALTPSARAASDTVSIGEYVRVISSSAALTAGPSHRSRIIRETELFEVLEVVERVRTFFLVKDPVTESFLYVDQYAVEFIDYLPPQPKRINPLRETMRLGTTHPDEQYFGSMKSPHRSNGEKANDGYCIGKNYPTSYDGNYSYTPRLDPGQLIRDAQRYTGTKYVLGGNSKSGIDCSGLICQAASNQGMSLPRRASYQAKEGLMVSRSQLRSGDLVFFRDWRDPGFLSHVGIYLGGGRFIHASMSVGKVGVSSLSEDYFSKHFAFGRRL